LLDVGAAAGYFVKVAQDDGWMAQGVEPSRWMAKYAKEKLDVKVQPGVIQDHKFKSESFDAITYWDVLEHVPNPLSDLKKTNKLLRKGGTLIVNYPDFDSLPAKIFKRKWWFILSIHLWYFTPQTITKLLNKAGFKVIKIQPHYQALELGYLTYRLKAYTELGYKILLLVFRVLGLLKFNLPYYAGQTMVIARKK
jgi:2-polyprenyl-3-methyl-5-hydroxy-6-metoxy-1,4-benzoquinol methylase